jgi:hypothetical protein
LNYEGSVCVRFRYSSYGSSLGRFYVTQSSNENNVQLDVNSDQGEQWIAASLDFNIVRNDKVYVHMQQNNVSQLLMVCCRLFLSLLEEVTCTVTSPSMTSRSRLDHAEVRGGVSQIHKTK